MAALIVAVSASAQGQGQGGRQGRDKGPGRLDARQEASLRSLAHALSGGYNLITRLYLTDEQKEVLSEIHARYTEKKQAATREITAQLPRLTKEDYGDPEKRKALAAKYAELSKKFKAAPPVDEVKQVLTPEQLEKIQGADKLVTEWQGWLVGHMAKCEERLTKEIGPMPEKRRFVYAGSERRGASVQLSSLALTDTQLAGIRQALKARPPADRGLSPHGLVARIDKLTPAQANAVRTALFTAALDRAKASRRAWVDKILTEEQRSLLAKGFAILEERDAEIGKRFQKLSADIEKLFAKQ